MDPLRRGPVRMLVLALLIAVGGQARAEDAGKTKYSVEIKGATLEEALKQLSQETGVGISIRRNKAQKTVKGKSYVNETLDQIIRDLLRNTNHILVWNHAERKASSVDIWLFPSGSGDAGAQAVPAKVAAEEAKDKNKPPKTRKREAEDRRAAPPKPAAPAAAAALKRPPVTPPAVGKLPPPLQEGQAASPQEEPQETKEREAPAQDHGTEEADEGGED